MTDNPDFAEAIKLLRNWAKYANDPWVADTFKATQAFLARHPEKPKLLPCPWAAHGEMPGRLGVLNVPTGWAVECDCGAHGPICCTEADAIAAWNRRSGPVSGGKPE